MKLKNPTMKTPDQKKITRRRCLEILALSGAAAALALKTTAPLQAAATEFKTISWRGILLGADAKLTLYATDDTSAKTAILNMLKEVKRLETYFSLYQETSLLNQLNNEGRIAAPPAEMQELIEKALELAKLTDGRFDPTIQPLFMAYKTLAKSNTKADWSKDQNVIAAKALIDWQSVTVSNREIAFAKKGMGLSLNGIAQGYITDKAVDLLKTAGFEKSLVNFGEYRAIGPKPGGAGWNIKLGKRDDAPIWTLEDKALAASAKNGLILNQETGLHHLLDPKTGLNQPAWQEIYVQAKTAVDADAASTALFATNPADTAELIRHLPIEKAYLQKSDGVLEFDNTHA